LELVENQKENMVGRKKLAEQTRGKSHRHVWRREGREDDERESKGRERGLTRHHHDHMRARTRKSRDPHTE
jgi:hypothetical protein